ncbi:AMP-binding protein [Halobaculum sp. MBLA0143]|uniref:AMP-binding protein n=1 Tax=Halobaculum sp. MBLA0143 TaxID=3079933 RepID=UPI0035240FE7
MTDSRRRDGDTEPCPNATVVGDLVGRGRRSPAPAVHAAARDRTYSYFDLCNTAAKAGNVLRHVGVRPGDTVAVEPRRAPEVAFTALGAWLIGATVAPTVAPGEAGDARALVVAAAAESAVTAPPGTSLVVFGDAPTTDGATHWEAEVWSENPAAPPAPTTADDTAVSLVDAADTPDATPVSHDRLLGLAGAAVDAAEIDARTAVVAAGDPASPRAIATGLLAPLAAAGTTVSVDGPTPSASDAPAAPDNRPTADETAVGEAVAAARELDGVERVVTVGGDGGADATLSPSELSP